MSSLTITTIQTGLKWEDKTANLQHFEARIESLREATELVILPEMFSTGFSMQPERLAETMDGPTLRWMADMAARKKIILTGSVIIEENGRYYNRLVWMLPNGQYGYYDKRHRFAYAGEDQHYTAGAKRLVASVKGWRVLLLVCYDLRFPVWSRQRPRELTGDPAAAARPAGSAGRPRPGGGSDAAEAPDLEYDLLLYVANWPERRSHAWKTLLQARAIENQCYVAGVNRIGNDGHDIYHSGDSMIIDPLGETLYHAGAKDETFTLTLEKDDLAKVRERFPFWRDADHFSIES
ncbi:MAG TPA: nitrilase family protein [Puia sp.]|nr:nitrilase family protein [Puia sp.]